MNHLVTLELQKIFRPLNLMQNIIFCPKYVIKKNYISPNNLRSFLISGLAAITFLTTLAYINYVVCFDKEIAFYSENQHVVTCLFDTFFYSVGFLINTVTAAAQTNMNVEFVISIQEVVIMFKNSFKKYTICNWLSMTIILVFYVAYISCCYIIFESINTSYICVIVLLVSFDINIFYAIRLIKLLERSIAFWNNMIRNTGGIRDHQMCQELFQAYDRILKCYDICNRSFEILVSMCLDISKLLYVGFLTSFFFQILYHMVETVLHMLLYVKSCLDSIITSRGLMSEVSTYE